MTGPLGKCRRCGQQSVTRVYFTAFLLQSKCNACAHEMKERPPILDKKVIYLDQWVISELANQLDPLLREKKGERADPFWRELYTDIEVLVKLHAAVFPESPLHYRESLVTPYLDVLRYLYEHLACGTRLEEPRQIHAGQLYDQFLKCVVRDESESGTWSSRDRVLDGKLNEWSDRVRISAHFPLRRGEVEAEKTYRADSSALLQADADRWKQQPGRSFAGWYDYHRRDLTDVVFRCFDENIPGLYAWICRSMVERLMGEGADRCEATERVCVFLRSDEATRVPYCEISSLLFAGISKAFADGGRQKPILYSDHNDIHAIAAYLPYCEAICVDSYFEELLRKTEIAREVLKYETAIFAPRQREDFQAYLRSIRAGVPADLHDTVLGVYGTKWLEPYDTILEYHRRKKAT